MQNYENSLGRKPEGNSEKEKGFLIPADDLAAAGLLCAHCRGELGYFIEDGRIIVEPSEDEEINEEEIWDALREYLPEDLCGMMEDAGFSPESIWNTLKEEGWFEP